MSRIGKKPILIPEGVDIGIDKQKISVKGPKGASERKVHPAIGLEIKDGMIYLAPKRKSQNSRALWGLWRALIANMVKGVKEGFEKKLQIEGVGYRAEVQDNTLSLQLGFSHPVRIAPPESVSFRAEKNIITVSGIDKQQVGQAAAVIRAKKPPEPYKGKGIRYEGERVRRKAGKKAAT